MSGSSLKGRKGKNPGNAEVKISSLIDLLDEQDESMRCLFAKALNLYVSPGAGAMSEKEKRDRLKRAIEDSFQEASTSC